MKHNSPESNQITILHLSDLHFNGENIIGISTVLDALFNDLQRLKEEFGVSPNIVVVSGDISNTGDQAEFNMALEWLNNLLQELKIPPNRVFIVPGNHDINRNELMKFSTIKFDNEEDVNKFLTDGGDERLALFKKLDNFYEFIKNFYGDKNPYDDRHYLATTMKIGKYKIGIAGLNTSWFSGERRFEGNIVVDDKALVVGEIQAKKLYKNTENTDLCLTLMHHPFSWLVDFEEGNIKRIVMKNSNLIFHGHIHSSSTTEFIDPDSRCLILSAGASYIKNRTKRYNICKINLNNFSYELYLRIYSDENKFWARDTLTYLTGEGIIHGKIIRDEHEEKLIKVYPFDEPDQDIERLIGLNWKKIVFPDRGGREEILELRREFFQKS